MLVSLCKATTNFELKNINNNNNNKKASKSNGWSWQQGMPST